MELLVSTSLITAFFAGIAALFAPCCIAVLLPAYFASIFKQKKKVFLMTFVFFLGILAVFLPLGLGFGGLGTLFLQLHSWIYGVGGVILILLGISIFAGFHPKMPFHVTPKLESQGFASIFLLGIFSGLSTVCCAPVLAGVLALSVLPASIFWGGMYSISYVLGMVLPLFIISLFLDKVNFTEKFLAFKKTITFNFFGKEINITIAKLIAGIMFTGMGILILSLALTGGLKMESSFLATVNIFTAKIINNISGFISKIPVFVFPLLIIVIISAIIKTSLNQAKKNNQL